jgi:hypothetical protein
MLLLHDQPEMRKKTLPIVHHIPLSYLEVRGLPRAVSTLRYQTVVNIVRRPVSKR